MNDERDSMPIGITERFADDQFAASQFTDCELLKKSYIERLSNPIHSHFERKFAGIDQSASQFVGESSGNARHAFVVFYFLNHWFDPTSVCAFTQVSRVAGLNSESRIQVATKFAARSCEWVFHAIFTEH